MLKTRVFRTSSFRLGVLFGAIAAASFVLLMWFTSWIVINALRTDAHKKFEAELASLRDDARTDGTLSIVPDIEERIRLRSGRQEYFWLADPEGKLISGNLINIRSKRGWQELTFSNHIRSPQKPGLETEDRILWAEGLTLVDGSFLLIGQDATDALATQALILKFYALAAAVTFILAASAGILVSRSLLRKIDVINATSQSIIDGKVKERIPLSGTSDEIDRLAEHLNKLFDSNEALIESLKHVSSNIAHDLRTPLTRLRQNLEIARASRGSVEAYEAAIDLAVDESNTLLSIFGALLRIAQIESGSRRSAFETLDLSDLVQEVFNTLQPVGEDSGRTITADIAPGIRFFGDRDLLTQMVLNIIENSIRHTPTGSEIGIKLSITDTGIRIVVSDNGPGIPVVQRRQVFDRFVRLDQSRSTPGSGLGLSLVSAVAKLHDIHITLDDNRPGLRVSLDFPKGEVP